MATTTHQPVRRAPLRLTRRGRLALWSAVLGLALGLLLLAAVAVSSAVLASSDAGAPMGVETVTIQPGQTLWDIAAANGADGDLRDTVYEIRQLNHLDGSEVQTGQTLNVPAS